MVNKVLDSMSWDELMQWEVSPMYQTYTENYELWLQGYDIDYLEYGFDDFMFTPKELMEYEQDVLQHILPVDTTGLSYQDVINIFDLPF